MSDIAFPPDIEREIPLPFKIASTELKRALDRIFYPILKKYLKDNEIRTLVDLQHISLPDEGKELLRIWYRLRLKDYPENDKKIWNKITDVFYGYDENHSELKDTNIVPIARDYLNTMEINGYNNWDYTAFEIRQDASTGFKAKGIWDQGMLSKPDAIDGFQFQKIEKNELLNLPHEDLIKNLISMYASDNNLSIPNPKKIKNEDVIFSLLSHKDDLTLGLIKFISNFFGTPDHDDYNPLSEKYGPSVNFCFRDNRKAVIFVQDIVDFYRGMYGFKNRITENLIKDSDLKQEKIIDLSNYETEVKNLISKMLHVSKIKDVDPKKIKLTDNIIMLANNDRIAAWSVIKSIMAHFNVIGMSGGLKTDFFNQTNPTVEDAIDFAREILEDSGSSYNEKHDLNIIKSELNDQNDNEELVKTVLKKHHYGIEYISERLRKNKNFIMELIKSGVAIYDNDIIVLGDNLKDDQELMEQILQKNPRCLKHISVNLQKNKTFLKKILEKYFQNTDYPSDVEFYNIDENLRDDKEIVNLILNNFIDKNYFFYDTKLLGPNLKKDKEITKKVLKLGGSIRYFDENILNDKDLVISALKQDVSNYKYIGAKIKSDPEILKITKETAIKQLNKDLDTHWGNLDETLKKDAQIKKIYDDKYQFYLNEIRVGNIENLIFDIPTLFRWNKNFFLDALTLIKQDSLDQYHEGIKQWLDMFPEFLKDEKVKSIIKELGI
jgi:hypothetical protein